MQSLPFLQSLPPSPCLQDSQSSSCCCPSAHRQLVCLPIVSVPMIRVLMVFMQSSQLSPEQGLFSFISSEMSYILNILLLTLNIPAPLMSLRGMPGPCPFNSNLQLSGYPSSRSKTPHPPPSGMGLSSGLESIGGEADDASLYVPEASGLNKAVFLKVWSGLFV